MLVNLHVKNFAIIDEIWLDFGQGFNVLSGETGAGKSILIGSINAALGGKISKDQMGTYADYALVELGFESDDPQIKDIFEKNDLIYEDGLVTISRRIASNGRSVCRVNGETVTAAVLKEIAGVLIDIHGQHEHQSLLYKEGQRRITDESSGECLKALDRVKSCYALFKAARSEYEEAAGSKRKSERELELLSYEAEEIKNARLKEGEDESLEERFRVLSNTERILEEIKLAEDALSMGNEPAEELLDRAQRALGKISSFDEKLAAFSERLACISEELGEFNAGLRDYAEGISGGEEEFEEVSERLDIINRLKSRYGRTIEEINAYADSCLKQLEEYSDYDSYLDRLKKQLSDRENELKTANDLLRKEREKAAAKLSESIENAMKDLNFENARFEIRIAETGNFSETGDTEPEFYLSANLGEPMKKLSGIISGGELSRIMLAIKSVAAVDNSTGTLVFDEIDTGISGRTAQKVAEKIALLSKSHQVICITHLPQLASMADNHFLIEKKQSDGHTRTGITRLEGEEVIDELSRMLGGAQITDTVRNSAREMKQLANETKKKI